MTDEDLEKRLRSNNSASYASVAISYEAADAIERLRARAEKAEAAFKNFHRMLCKRFGYSHDERHWKRDQVSLMEDIATSLTAERQRAEKVQAELSAITAVMSRIGTEFLDPPDGGDVPLGEQIGRLIDAHEKAEREQDEAIARAKTSAVLAATETGKLMKVIAGADELERETIERCARVAEEWGIDSAGFGSVPADPFAAMRMAGESIAAAIRAMRDGTP